MEIQETSTSDTDTDSESDPGIIPEPLTSLFDPTAINLSDDALQTDASKLYNIYLSNIYQIFINILFNIFINDIFLSSNETEICNYADDTTIYCSHKELQEVTLRLENDTVKLSNWFEENFMKLNEKNATS